MSKEQALQEAEAFIRRSVQRTGSNVAEKDIKAAAQRVVRSLPPVKEPA
ncbi:MAG: hypothetical protein ACM3ZV_05345 [Bacillota bacterium]|jgi:hypothetical protein